MFVGNVPDQLLDDNGLANPSASKQPDLAALGEGRQEVDDLDAGLQDLPGRTLFRYGWRRTMDRVVVLGLNRAHFINRLAKDIKKPAQGCSSHRDHDRRLGIQRLYPAPQAVRRRHSHTPDHIVPSVLQGLQGHVELFGQGCFDVSVLIFTGDLDGMKKVRKLPRRKFNVYNRTDNLNNMAVVFSIHHSITSSIL